MNRSFSLTLTFLLAVSLTACGAEQESDRRPVVDVPAEDLIPVDVGKGDGSFFFPNRLIDDAVFEDAGYLSAQDVQAFFEKTPYRGSRSFLADYEPDGVAASKALVDGAKARGINPLVLLVKLQVEAGIVSKTERPSDHLLDRALGCACPDNAPCDPARQGFAAQVDCAASVFGRYLDDLDEDGATISGWAVEETKETLDEVKVTPANRATAALYTYTPWVLEGEGGNWLFWNILRRYMRHILAEKPNHRWIGGPCASEDDCSLEGSVCLRSGGIGLCSKTCDRLCPDSASLYTSGTFCTALNVSLEGEPSGFCVSNCDEALFPDTGGCRQGFVCTEATRFAEVEVQREVCLPEGLGD